MTINTKWTKRLQSIRRIIWTGARLLILAYAIWVLVYLVGRLWIPGNDHGFIAASHNLTPWFGPIGLVLLITALFSRWRWPLVAALAPAGADRVHRVVWPPVTASAHW